jgi:uncharacterized membrane protein YeaQ/YmgE (transglycosylase-associated protein family)
VGLLAYLVVTALMGLFIGALGRLALPGPDPMSIWATIAIGIVATWLAGLFIWYVFDEAYGAGIPIAAAFATLIVYLIRKSRGGGLTDPGLDRRRPR